MPFDVQSTSVFTKPCNDYPYDSNPVKRGTGKLTKIWFELAEPGVHYLFSVSSDFSSIDPTISIRPYRLLTFRIYVHRVSISVRYAAVSAGILYRSNEIADFPIKPRHDGQ